MSTRSRRACRESDEVPVRDDEGRGRRAAAVLAAGIVLAIVAGTALSLLLGDPLWVGIGLAGIGGGSGVIASVIYAGDDRPGTG